MIGYGWAAILLIAFYGVCIALVVSLWLMLRDAVKALESVAESFARLVDVIRDKQF